MGNTRIKNFYKKMPISEKCCICKNNLLVETKPHFVYQCGCKVCRLKKYFSTNTNDEVL